VTAQAGSASCPHPRSPPTRGVLSQQQHAGLGLKVALIEQRAEEGAKLERLLQGAHLVWGVEGRRGGWQGGGGRRCNGHSQVAGGEGEGDVLMGRGGTRDWKDRQKCALLAATFCWKCNVQQLHITHTTPAVFTGDPTPHTPTHTHTYTHTPTHAPTPTHPPTLLKYICLRPSMMLVTTLALTTLVRRLSPPDWG
jgi:hypothetical protein